MNDAFIVEAIRTPMGRGKAGGQLSDLHPAELLAQTYEGLIARTRVEPGDVEDLIIGCVSQGGEQAGTPGRQAWLAAGYPEQVPSVTIDRRCGSSQQAIHFAAQGIMAGSYDVVIAGGIESMSRVPMGSARMGQDIYGPRVHERYSPGLVDQGVASDLLADRFSLSREDLDTYAARSHQRAAAARSKGWFDREIVPIRSGGLSVAADETIRPATTLETLSALQPSFGRPEAQARFPSLVWKTGPGNSSQITDGAAATLLMSKSAARDRGLQPRARFASFAARGDDPMYVGLNAPIPAAQKALEKAGLTIDQIDHIEVNEAFASVPLAFARAFEIDPQRLNPNGGAIALGHPLGASGARIFATALHELERTGGRYALIAICEAFGMANATIIERI